MNLALNVLAANAIAPREDLDFFAEHLIESALDARYFALPWPDSSAPSDKWRPFVSIAGADFGGDPGKASGGLFTVGLEHAWSKRTSYSLLAYYDRFNVYGAGSSSVLTFGTIRNPPIDIPENVVFSDPSGRFVHAAFEDSRHEGIDDVLLITITWRK